MGKVIKEVIFVALFLAVVILIIGILFYEFIPNQVIPEGTSYKQTSGTAKLLSQIKEEQQAEEEDNKSESVLKSYEVTGDELDNYSNQKKYVQGKNHPFFDYTKISTDSTQGNGTSNGSGNSSNSTSEANSNNDNNSSSNSNNTTNSSNQNTTTNQVDTTGLRDTSNTSKTSK